LLSVSNDLGGLVPKLTILLAGLVDGLFDLNLGVHRTLCPQPEERAEIIDDSLEHVCVPLLVIPD